VQNEDMGVGKGQLRLHWGKPFLNVFKGKIIKKKQFSSSAAPEEFKFT
jgi:hypothetical protein